MAFFADSTSYGHGAFKVIIVAAVLILMQTLMVGGRFASRKLRKVSLAADDYVLLTAAIFSIGLCALALAFPRIAGVGAPNALVQLGDFSEGTVLGQSYMACLILYGLAIALSKCAILLLYVRVFTTSSKTFSITVFLTSAIVIATGIADTFVAIFQCSPVTYEWKKSIRGGKCIDELAFTRYTTIPNVVTRAIILIIPLPLLWKLNLTVPARISLIATFMHGTIGFIASCARLSIFFHTNASSFTNNTSLLWTIWTIVEPANYTIAASLPTLRPIFQRLLPPSSFVPSNSSKRSTPRNSNNPLQNPSSSRMVTRLSPLEGVREGEATLGTGTRGSPYEECWVDVEAGVDDKNTDSDHSHHNSNEQRHAAMRVPERNEGCKDDEVVVETMIQVSAVESQMWVSSRPGQ